MTQTILLRHDRNFEVFEELASLKSLHGTTTGEDLFFECRCNHEGTWAALDK
jgi:hypothetical protein